MVSFLCRIMNTHLEEICRLSFTYMLVRTQLLSASTHTHAEQSCTELLSYVIVKHGGFAPAKGRSRWKGETCAVGASSAASGPKRSPGGCDARRWCVKTRRGRRSRRFVGLQAPLAVRKASYYVATHSEFDVF